MNDSCILVRLPSLSRSLHIYPPLTAVSETATVLEVCLARLRSGADGVPLVVSFDREWSDHPVLRECIERAGGFPITAEDRLETSALLNALSRTQARRVVDLNLEAALGPLDLASRCLIFHIGQDHTFTEVRDLPAGCHAEVVDGSLLEELRDFPSGAVSGGPAGIVRAILNASATTGEPVPSSIRAGGFSFLEEYRLTRQDLPEYLLLADGCCLTAVRSALVESGAEQAAGLMSAIKREWIRDAESSRRPVPSTRCGTLGTLRVLYVTNPSAYSGAEESLCQMIAGVRAKGVETTALVASAGRLTDRLHEFGVRTLCPNQDFSRPNRVSVHVVNAAIAEARPDIIHVNGSSGTTVSTVSESREIPLVYHLRTISVDRFADEWRGADACIAVSKVVRQRALACNIAPNRVHVVYDGIDTASFRPGCFEPTIERAELDVPASRDLVIGMIARLTPYKRHDVAIHALASLLRTGLDAELVIVGENFSEAAYYDQLLRCIDNAGLRGRVRLSPFQNDIRRFHSAIDVLVSCAVGDALGTAVLEAMSMEVPVVIADSGGLPELLRDGETGRVIPPEDSEALARTLLDLHGDRNRARKMAADARQHIVRELTIQHCAEATLSVYDAVCTGVAPHDMRVAAGIECR